MHLLIAADSFKEALPAPAVCAAIAEGLRSTQPELSIALHPLSDGGEGSLEILTTHLALRRIATDVHDPLGRWRRASFGLSKDGRTAYIELAQAAGLQLLTPSERDPLRTHTFGVGELIAAACARGVERIVLSIGGSATNDAGMGMLAALGWRFLDGDRQPIEPRGGELLRIEHIVPPANLQLPNIDVLCDVTNPLAGRNGAAHCYARQKGADPAAIDRLDAGLRHFAHKVAALLQGLDLQELPGAGAAGGVGFAARALLHATLHRGSDYLLDVTEFDRALAHAELVITGEGRLDAQTLQGKLIHGICQRAARHGVPVIALCGELTVSAAQLKRLGLHAAYDINAGAPPDLPRTAERLRTCAAHLSLTV